MFEIVELKSPIIQTVILNANINLYQDTTSPFILQKTLKSVPYFIVNKVSKIGPVYLIGE